jgi:tRNA pseudouridine38-40 synthase
MDPGKAMTRFKLRLEYQGTRYRGWQVQKNAHTVQGELLAAVRSVSGESDIELQGGGRTDAGVHALGQVAHLDLKTSPSPEQLRRSLNDALPPDICVTGIEEAPARFHARHDAVARSYLYQICRRKTALGKKLVWWVRDPLDFTRMQAAGELFVGMKDFRSFSADEPEEKSTKVLIERVAMKQSGDLILIRVEGSHFLWKMVRRIVGVIVAAGRGQLSLDQVADFFGVRSDEPAKLTAPPSGLFLERIYYQGDARLKGLAPVLNIGAVLLRQE